MKDAVNFCFVLFCFKARIAGVLPPYVLLLVACSSLISRPFHERGHPRDAQ